MKEFLRRIKLIDSMTTTLPTNKGEFVHRLNEITDKGSTGMMSDAFDVFTSNKKEFKGQVNSDGFAIKRRRRFFDMNMNFAVAHGTLTENNEQLSIETEIKGFNNFFIAFYIFLIIFYIVFIFSFLSDDIETRVIAVPFILVHATFMFGIPYLILRRSVGRLKYELEREFYYLTK